MDSSMISAQALIIPVDFGQIYVRAALAEPDEWDEDEQPPELAVLDDAWESGRFVGVRAGFIDVLTPGQWNWHTPLQLELWSAEPPDVRAGWDHEVDADLDVTDGQLYIHGPQSATMDEIVNVSSPPGSYRVRVSGRGFTELGHAGADGEDSYRLRWWPRGQASPALLRKRWPGWDRYPAPSRRPEDGRSGDSPAPEPGSAEGGAAQTRLTTLSSRTCRSSPALS